MAAPLSQPTGQSPLASPAGSVAAEIPVPPETTQQEEELLFGTGQPGGQQTAGGNPFQGLGTAAATPAVPTVQERMLEMLANMVQQQQEQTKQTQQMLSAMLRRMDLEDERRFKAEREREEEAKKEAVPVANRDPFATSGTASASSSSGPKPAGSGGMASNRADKYLPQLPVIAHQEMGRDRMREIEAWHGFLETLSSWLALQDEAYVNNLRLCIGVKDEIQQDRLPADTAARSAKLFYLLSQSLAKWERGLELLRSCSKRQNMSATGYEAVRTIHMNYSIVSRMEAVYVREACMKIHAKCGHLKKPMDIIRHLEDGIAKAEVKLSNFPELKLTEADRCSLLQAVSHQARQYVALHGNAQSWGELTKSLKYFEEQLRMCEPIPTSSSRSMNDDILCDYCGRKGHKKDKCWAREGRRLAYRRKPGIINFYKISEKISEKNSDSKNISGKKSEIFSR